MTPADAERRLAAILSADVAGYSRLMADDEDATVRTLRAWRDQVSALIAEHRGRLADFTGDNFLAEFPAARDAVACALEIQRVLEARNSALPEPRRMRFRIGAHLGDVRHQDGRLFGDGVNIAARLQPLAEPGGLCISSTLADVVRGKLPIALDAMGEQTLRNIPERVRAFRVRLVSEGAISVPTTRASLPRWLGLAAAALALAAIAGFAYVARDRTFEAASEPIATPAASDLGPIRAIAVLPLTNLSGDPEQEFFADGMTETLIAELSKLPGVRVISRTSVMQFKGTKTALPEIAKTLNVEGVIEGSVMRAGNEVRITAQLVDARADRHLWAQQYDRELARVLEIQSEVARAVAAQIQLALKPEQSARLKAPMPVDPRAQDAYLRGLAFRQQFTPEGLAAAVANFEEAARIAPDYASAYAALSSAHYFQGGMRGPENPKTLIAAKAAARRAVELDDSLGDAHMALGRALIREYEFAAAERELRRGLDLGVSDPVLTNGLAFLLFVTNRQPEGLRLMDDSVAQAPLDPFVRAQRLSFWALDDSSRPAVVQECDRILELRPGYSPALLFRAVAYEVEGRLELAVQTFEQVGAILPEFASVARSLADGLKQGGRAGYWRAKASRSDVTFLLKASAYAQLEEFDAAFAALEQSYESCDGSLAMIAVDPLLRPLHRDPRFAELARRIHLPLPPGLQSP